MAHLLGASSRGIRLAGRTVFCWANGHNINNAALTPTMPYSFMSVRDIDVAANEFKPVTLLVCGGDGWTMLGGRISFGWLVNPLSGAANETITLPGLENGKHKLSFCRRWRGFYEDPIAATLAGGALTVRVPELRPRGGHTQNAGNDLAFNIVTKGPSVESQ